MTEKSLSEKTQTPDAFSRAVLRKIDYFISQSEIDPFSADQITIIEKGVISCQPKTHPIDIRGVLPFHFFKFFYVVLMGHDKRKATQTTADDVRQTTKPLAHVIYWVTAIWPFYVAAYFGYWILNHMPPF